jgi:glycine hydroxymethyltransferase
MDLRGTGVTGKELEARLDECYITVNKNTIPNEPLSPFVTSGVRIGTAAVTTRGLKEDDMDKIAEYITLVLKDFDANADKVRAGVEEICAKYPLYE